MYVHVRRYREAECSGHSRNQVNHQYCSLSCTIMADIHRCGWHLLPLQWQLESTAAMFLSLLKLAWHIKCWSWHGCVYKCSKYNSEVSSCVRTSLDLTRAALSENGVSSECACCFASTGVYVHTCMSPPLGQVGWSLIQAELMRFEH